ncbi:MAG: hypothetical protein P4L73_09830 [Caulobacteraceae bacterium]|nr:hypothetical protein [Caulobacteraceae bacterium]
MPSTDDADLRDQILHFLLTLPSTIREDVVILVLLYATGENRLVEAEAVDRLAKFLGEAPGPRLVGALLRTIMATDYVLARDPRGSQDHAFLSGLAKQTPSPLAALAEQLLLGLPLRERHHRAAWAKWSHLRAAVLTLQAVRNLEAEGLGSAFERAMVKPDASKLLDERSRS